MRCEFHLFRTPAHQKLTDSEKQLRIAALRISLESVTPRIATGLPNPASVGILRDGANAYTLDARRKIVTGDAAMRAALGIRSIGDVMRNDRPSRGLVPIAFSGLGNVAMNEYCVGLSKGVLIHRIDEGSRLLHDAYQMLNVTDSDATIENGHYVMDPQAGCWRVCVDGNVRPEVSFSVSGQRLLSGGSVIDPYRDPEQTARYSDTRHLILNGYVKMTDRVTNQPACDSSGRQIQLDFGLGQLLADASKLKDAIRGEPVQFDFDMTDSAGRELTITPDDLREAFLLKGYSECKAVSELDRLSGERGFFVIDMANRQAYVVYHQSPYPHHFVAIREDEPGVFYDFAIGGFSNNAGINVLDLARDLRNGGFSDALLLDQGGDSVLVHAEGREPVWDPNGPDAVIPSSLRRSQWANILVYDIEPASGFAGIGLFIGERVAKTADSEMFAVDFG